MSQAITLTRALTELGRLEARIGTAVVSGTYFALVKGDQQIPENREEKTKSDLIANLRGNVKSVQDLINRRIMLQSKIAQANAVTIVRINGAEMTIAEALARKANAEHLASFLNQLRAQHRSVAAAVQAANTRLENTIQQTVDSMYGKSDASKIPADAREVIAAPLLAKNKLALVHGLGDDTSEIELKKLADEQEAFATEIDFALSEINARTEITL